MTTLPQTDASVPQYLLERERAQRGDTLIRYVAIGLGVLLIAAAAGLQAPINAQRAALQLSTQDVEAVPAKYAWITAVAGTFRGLAVDLLWMRAEKLKEEGKYYESHQLADWICTLQPRFAAVWQWHAWNLSYNISVATHTPEERWKWVYDGIRLLRDRGIPNNPRAIGLYKELSWIIFHKVGDILDDMHNYYKREWAAMFENLLGPPPLVVDAKQTVDAFRPIAEAPPDWDAFVAAHPDILPHAEALRNVGVDVEKASRDQLRHPLEATFFDRYGALILDAAAARAKYRKEARTPAPGDKAFVDAFRAIRPPLADALLAYLRAKVLREQYKMDPRFMLSLMTDLIPGKPGMLVPFDWRLAESHAIYWSRYGVREGRKLKSVADFDLLNTDRFTLYSLMTLCKRGRLIFEFDRAQPNRSTLSFLYDLRMVEPMHEMFLALGKVHADKDENVGDTAGEMLKSGHINTLEEAIALHFARGSIAEATKYFEYLRDNYKEFDGSTKDRYSKGVRDLVLGNIKEMVDSTRGAAALIQSFVLHAFLSLADGDGEAYGNHVGLAKEVYDKYMKDKGDDREGRRSLPPFPDMVADILMRFLADTPSMVARITVWEGIELPLRQAVYNETEFVDALREQCEDLGYDFNKAFPEPPGMAEYSKTHPRRLRQEEVTVPSESE
jgi:hypothetical protein